MKYIFGNWKMYLDFDESNILANALLQEKFDENNLKLAIFPSALAIREVIMAMENSVFSVGAQNVSWVEKGGYTGAISAQMFLNVGSEYALVGHSERRHIFGETDEDVRKKLQACLEIGLTPVLCIGEKKEEKDSGLRNTCLQRQLAVLAGLDLKNKEILIAYEPVWAIGTGNACDPVEAEQVHHWIKEELKKYSDQEIPILYGGSVKAENVISYVSLPAIDGVLVGGASAKFETFVSIIKKVEEII